MRKLALSLGLMLFSCILFAQTTIIGKITDSKTGNPLSGVSVKSRSSKTGTQTNNEGVFKIQANVGDELEISSIGYKIQRIKI
ncbi:MAG TPA: carboxypeptidase-like regulatory domain-containing protein, partial [Puia sp.]|nr:carboxypeptidase-like regulatory domain-containing protein [Puia sp.]